MLKYMFVMAFRFSFVFVMRIVGVMTDFEASSEAWRHCAMCWVSYKDRRMIKEGVS